MIRKRVPLIVDVDGTLLKSDLLWEGFVYLLTRRPERLAACLLTLARGKAAFKAFVARESEISLEHLPLEPLVVELIERARSEGSAVVLASGSDGSHIDDIGARVGADVAWGSDGSTNLTGERKLMQIRAHFDEFDYVGNSLADLPLWRAARRPIAFNAGYLTIWKAKRARPDMVILSRQRPTWRAWIRALRPHHWAKNTLMFLPVLAAHLDPSPGLALRLVAGFASFSALASAVYLFNDLADLAADRAHQTKRFRPLAAGEISIPAALFVAISLLVVSATLAMFLPPAFGVVLAGYFIITSAYSLFLKQRAAIDVITLATLYTVRIIAGAALTSVELSRWFLAFSIFLFLSLALVKRVVELQDARDRQVDDIAGRGYRPEDLPVLGSMGAASAAVSALVYCLYITGDDVLRLYSRPDVLWLGLPIFLYWIIRLWLFVARGTLHEDPVAFALKDRATYVVLVLFLLTVFVAT